MFDENIHSDPGVHRTAGVNVDSTTTFFRKGVDTNVAFRQGVHDCDPVRNKLMRETVEDRCSTSFHCLFKGFPNACHIV